MHGCSCTPAAVCNSHLHTVSVHPTPPKLTGIAWVRSGERVPASNLNLYSVVYTRERGGGRQVKKETAACRTQARAGVVADAEAANGRNRLHDSSH